MELFTREEGKCRTFKYFNFYGAKVFLAVANPDKALSYAKAFLIKSLKQAYAWELFADCQANEALKRTFLTKAVLMQKELKYSVGSRNKLLKLFDANTEVEMRAYLAQTIVNIRSANSWPVSQDIYKWANMMELIKEKEISCERRLQEIGTNALRKAFPESNESIAVISGKLDRKPVYFAMAMDGQTYKFKYKAQLQTGRFVKLQIINNNILEVSETNPPEKPEGAIKHFQGTFKAVKNFGFITDVYIPPFLSKAIKPGTDTHGYAIKELNPKTKKEGWKAVSISSFNNK
jgi:hypothetical protein